MKSELISETWKPVIGYENLYEVSSFGRIRNSRNYFKNQFGNYYKSDKNILSTLKNNSGYLTVNLSKFNKTKRLLIHRLVYETFIGAISEGLQVNHINEIKTDNSVWNLNLMTPKENCNYGHAKLKKSKKLFQYSLDKKLIREYNSLSEASKDGFNIRHVSSCCLGKRKHHKKFLWSYIPL